MKTVLVFAVGVLAAARTPTSPTSLCGTKVLRVVPQTEDQLHGLHQLLLQDHYDFWKEPRAVGSPVDIMASSPLLPELTASLTRYGLETNVQISDVGHLVDEQFSQRLRGFRPMDWTDYHNYDTINKWLVSLPSDYPDLCTLEEVGKSYEGRAMNLLTVGKGGADKPGIFIDGGIHAREWISPATVTYMVNELLTNSSAYDDLLSSVNFYVMPVTNPDGYAYTFKSPDNRLWRKTRSETDSVLGCKGVDPNRNWDFHWNEVGAFSNPCSSKYAGPEPFSEVEMRVVADQIKKLEDNIKVYLSFHSYSQLWMYPWGYTSDLPDDWEELDELAQDAVSALSAVHGTIYEIGSISNIIYPASGNSVDWAKEQSGIKYAYGVELRDKGNHGYLLPRSQIITSGEETFKALMVFANFVRETYSD